LGAADFSDCRALAWFTLISLAAPRREREKLSDKSMQFSRPRFADPQQLLA
jgi:hypothetical protein